jgi:hypothetical protein
MGASEWLPSMCRFFCSTHSNVRTSGAASYTVPVTSTHRMVLRVHYTVIPKLRLGYCSRTHSPSHTKHTQHIMCNFQWPSSPKQSHCRCTPKPTKNSDVEDSALASGLLQCPCLEMLVPTQIVSTLQARSIQTYQSRLTTVTADVFTLL